MRTMKIMLAAVLLMPVGLSASAAAAEPPGESAARFQKANADYDRKAYAEAGAGYAALVGEGNRSANLFFNLGNAQYRLGEKGAAILNYERALALEPGHPEARANLDFVRKELQPQQWEQPLWERVLEWPETATHRQAAWAGALFFWVTALSVAPLFWRRKVFLPGVLLGGALALWCGGAVYSAAMRPGLWIVTARQAPVRSAPVDSAKTARKLATGSEVRVLLERGSWLYVALPGGERERGWMPRSVLEPVNPDRVAIPPETSPLALE